MRHFLIASGSTTGFDNRPFRLIVEGAAFDYARELDDIMARMPQNDIAKIKRAGARANRGKDKFPTKARLLAPVQWHRK